jgi:hypothetical protein
MRRGGEGRRMWGMDSRAQREAKAWKLLCMKSSVWISARLMQFANLEEVDLGNETEMLKDEMKTYA